MRWRSVLRSFGLPFSVWKGGDEVDRKQVVFCMSVCIHTQQECGVCVCKDVMSSAFSTRESISVKKTNKRTSKKTQQAGFSNSRFLVAIRLQTKIN